VTTAPINNTAAQRLQSLSLLQRDRSREPAHGMRLRRHGALRHRAFGIGIAIRETPPASLTFTLAASGDFR
jgi:hypothetical protein